MYSATITLPMSTRSTDAYMPFLDLIAGESCSTLVPKLKNMTQKAI